MRSSAALLQDLRGRVARRVLVGHLDHHVATLEPTEVHRELAIVELVGSADQDEEVRELLGAVGGETHVPVGGRLDRRDLDHPRRATQGRPAEELGEHRRVGVHGQRHAIEDRDVDVLASPRTGRGAQRREHRDRGVRARHPLADPAAGGQAAAPRGGPGRPSIRTSPGG